jgi:hypothetical protein
MAPTALPYCLQAQNETHGFPNRECLYWDENLVLCGIPSSSFPPPPPPPYRAAAPREGK